MIPGLATYILLPLIQKGQLSVTGKNMCTKYWYRIRGLSLPRKSAVSLTDHPDMTLDVYHGRKTTTQQQPFYLPFYRTFRLPCTFERTGQIQTDLRLPFLQLTFWYDLIISRVPPYQKYQNMGSGNFKFTREEHIRFLLFDIMLFYQRPE